MILITRLLWMEIWRSNTHTHTHRHKKLIHYKKGNICSLPFIHSNKNPSQPIFKEHFEASEKLPCGWEQNMNFSASLSFLQCLLLWKVQHSATLWLSAFTYEPLQRQLSEVKSKSKSATINSDFFSEFPTRIADCSYWLCMDSCCAFQCSIQSYNSWVGSQNDRCLFEVFMVDSLGSCVNETTQCQTEQSLVS